MEKKENVLQGKKLPLVLLAASCGMYNILYLCVIFYVPFQQAFGFTNVQMGALLGAYALLGTPGQFFSGLISDLWNPKYMLVTACVLTSCCGFALAFFPPYSVTLIIFGIMAIPIGFMHWAAYCKCVGMMGDNSQQGRLFGFCNTVDGALTCVLTLGLTAIFGNAMGTQGNFRIVIIVMSSVYFLSGIGIAVFYDYKKWSAINGQASGEKKKFSWFSIIEVFKQPLTWIAAVMVMGSYMAATCFTYMSPYLNAVYVLPVGLASAFGVITRYGVKVFASPIGGVLRDKKLGGSTSKLGWVATAGVCIFTAILLLLPKSNAFVVPAVIVALLTIFSFRLNNSSESTIYRQLNSTPQYLLGTIIGVASVVGYSSDLWLPRLIGNILDKNGDAGYKYVFMILCASLLLMSAAGYVLYRLYKKEQQEEVATAAKATV